MKRYLLPILWVLVLWLWLLIVGTGVAKADFEQYEPVPVQTTCLTPWDAPLAWGYTRTDQIGWPVYLSPYVCDALHAGPTNPQFPNAIAVLYHEWVHSWFRDRNEGDAECVSLFFLRYQLRHAWGLSPVAAQIVYDVAWRTHEVRAGLFPAYRGVCDQDQPDPVP
jgi:hypothetical protein